MNTSIDCGAQNATSATLALALGRQPAPSSQANSFHISSFQANSSQANSSQPSLFKQSSLHNAYSWQFLAEPDDEQAFDITETMAGRQPGTAQSGTAGSVYAQRVGAAPPAGHNIVHLNSVSLAGRHILEQGLGAALAAATPPRRILICGNADTDVPARHAALLALDAKGTAVGDVALVSRDDKSKPFGRSDATSVLARYAATTDADIFIAVLGDLARVEAARGTLRTERAYHAARQDALHRLDTFFVQLLAVRHLDTSQVDCLLVSPCPPSVCSPSADNILGHMITSEDWEQLTPILAIGPDFSPGLLASPTTRTVGLVANLDLAPTILHLLGVSAPLDMIGHPMQSQSAPSLAGMAIFEARQQYISRLDFVTTLNAQARAKFITTLLGSGFLLAPAALLVYWRAGKSGARKLSPVLIFLLNLPAGCLLATILIPPTLFEYSLRIAAWMIALTIASYLLARALRTTPLAAGSLLSIGVIVLDIWRGQALLLASLLSEFSLSGHHRYGAGSAYAALLLGYALASGCGLYWQKQQRLSSPCRNDMEISTEMENSTETET